MSKLQSILFKTFFQFFKKIFGGHQSFLWATNTPILDFLWHLPCVSKPGLTPLLVCFVTYAQWNPQIPLEWHLLTSWWLAWQPSHSHPHTCEEAFVGLETGIYHMCHCFTMWDQVDALPTELYISHYHWNDEPSKWNSSLFNMYSCCTLNISMKTENMPLKGCMFAQ